MADEKDSNAEVEEAVGEEDYSGQYTPVVQLKEVKTVTSDEGEEIVWENKCKLYRFDEDAWKERGLGMAKILKNKETHKQRFIMHEDKTFKLRSNHLILTNTKLQQHGGNPKALVFSTIDFADGDPREESLCIRFGTAEKAEEFRTKYEEAIKENAKYLTQSSSKSEEDKVSPAKEEDKGVEELSKDLAEKATVEEEGSKAE